LTNEICQTKNCAKPSKLGWRYCCDCINGLPPEIPPSGELREAALAVLRLGGSAAVKALVVAPARDADMTLAAIRGLRVALGGFVNIYGYVNVLEVLREYDPERDP
jgi:hypothetical protein